jgi:uncharacterized oxidoreductase
MNIKNKMVMITGGSSGFGLQMAKSFFAEGGSVLICARAGEELEQVKKDNPAFETYSCDLSSPNEVKDLIMKVGSRVDIWVNNAGIFLTYNFLKPDKPFDALQTELQLNFVAAAIAITELIPYLKNKPEAAIVTITAGMVYVPLVMNPMYNASKAALHSFIVSARVQLKSTNILMIEIAPPMVATKLTEGMEGKRVSPGVIANAVINAIKTKKENVLVGQVKSLVFMNKFFPKMMLNLLNKGS